MTDNLFPFYTSDFFRVGVSLAIGLLIGIERGWEARAEEEGHRIAGIRTFGLMGLFGGCIGLLTKTLGGLLFGLSFMGFAIILATAYIANLAYHQKTHLDISITSLIAGLLTFALGALASLGYVALAGSAAVIAALLLGLKPVLHSWLRHLEEAELHAGLKLLLISVVLLSILPNQGYGPWNAFNPFEIWWLVVLVASISFIGYFAMKIIGTKKGVMLTAIFAGMTSSTALTFHFSKLIRDDQKFSSILSLGILSACSMMYLRTLIFITLLNPILLPNLLAPLGAMMIANTLPVLLQWRKATRHIPTQEKTRLRNPLELKAALVFGLLLTLVVLLTKFLQQEFGDLGLYALAAITGLVDIDAFVLPLLRFSLSEIDPNTVATAIIVCAATNSLLKGFLAVGVGGTVLIRGVLLPLSITALVGVVVAIAV